MLPWLVHLLTASGAVLAWLALAATVADRPREAFLWLALATAIDAVDGALARAARVKERAPGLDGARLDDIVDYLTFVFVPAWMIARWGIVPGSWAPWVAAAMLLSSAYGFSQVRAKSSDHYFTGFPSYWNIVVLYLVVGGLPPGVNAAILVFFAVLVFVPVGYVYPSRTPAFRRTTLTLGVAWGILTIAMILLLPLPPRWIVWGSLSYGVYYTLLSFWLQARRLAANRQLKTED